MDRRRFIGTVASGLLAAPLAAETQQAAKIARIGYLNPNPNTANPRLFDAFRQGMRELGYTEVATSSSRSDPPRGIPSNSKFLRPNWWRSR